MAFLEEVCHWGDGFEVLKHYPTPGFPFRFALAFSEVSAQLVASVTGSALVMHPTVMDP